VPAERCFSIITADKVVAAEFASKAARDAFAEQLRRPISP
jgi:hypothetical protein